MTNSITSLIRFMSLRQAQQVTIFNSNNNNNNNILSCLKFLWVMCVTLILKSFYLDIFNFMDIRTVSHVILYLMCKQTLWMNIVYNGTCFVLQHLFYALEIYFIHAVIEMWLTKNDH